MPGIAQLRAQPPQELGAQETSLKHILPAAFSPLRPHGLPAFVLSVLRSGNHTLSFSMMMEILGGSLWTQGRDLRAAIGVEDSGRDGS